MIEIAPHLQNTKLTLGYIRVSTDRQDLSIEAQTECVKRAAEYHRSGELSLFAEPDTSGSTEFAKRDLASVPTAQIQSLAEQLKQLALVTDPEAQARAAGLLESQRGMLHWTIEVMKTPPALRK